MRMPFQPYQTGRQVSPPVAGKHVPQVSSKPSVRSEPPVRTDTSCPVALSATVLTVQACPVSAVRAFCASSRPAVPYFPAICRMRRHCGQGPREPGQTRILHLPFHQTLVCRYARLYLVLSESGTVGAICNTVPIHSCRRFRESRPCPAAGYGR